MLSPMCPLMHGKSCRTMTVVYSPSNLSLKLTSAAMPTNHLAMTRQLVCCDRLPSSSHSCFVLPDLFICCLSSYAWIVRCLGTGTVFSLHVCTATSTQIHTTEIMTFVRQQSLYKVTATILWSRIPRLIPRLNIMKTLVNYMYILDLLGECGGLRKTQKHIKQLKRFNLCTLMWYTATCTYKRDCAFAGFFFVCFFLRINNVYAGFFKSLKLQTYGLKESFLSKSVYHLTKLK